eukprot:8705785-Pyramimonas_sp.AAC.1
MAKELAPEGIHVAHVVVDGMVDMPIINAFMPDLPPGRMIDSEAIAEAYWHLHTQVTRMDSLILTEIYILFPRTLKFEAGLLDSLVITNKSS